MGFKNRLIKIIDCQKPLKRNSGQTKSTKLTHGNSRKLVTALDDLAHLMSDARCRDHHRRSVLGSTFVARHVISRTHRRVLRTKPACLPEVSPLGFLAWRVALPAIQGPRQLEHRLRQVEKRWRWVAASARYLGRCRPAVPIALAPPH